MATSQNRIAACWVSLLLSTFLLPLASSSSRHLSPSTLADVISSSQHSSRQLQGTTATPGGSGAAPGNPGELPSNPGDVDAMSALAKEGEQCNSGGNLMPTLCEPGLTCNITAPQPTAGSPGFHPDYAAVGVCVRATINATAAIAKEGENCTTGGSASQPAVGCVEGLFCDTMASLPQPGFPQDPVTILKGVCRKAAPTGGLCFAGGVLVLPAEDEPSTAVKAEAISSTPVPDSTWSALCAPGLVCFVMDPSPSSCEKQSAAVQSKMASLDMSTKLLGYCVNQSAVPILDSRQGSGMEAGVCKVGVPLPKSESPCQEGLTCATPIAMLPVTGTGAVTYGICADSSLLLQQLSSDSMKGNETEVGVVATSGNSSNVDTPTSSFSAAKSATQLLYKQVGLVGVAFCLALVL